MIDCITNCTGQKLGKCTLEKCDKNKADINKLVNNVKEWACNRALISEKNAPTQSMKIIEELGETMRAYLKNDRIGLIDGIGDTFVTLIIFAEQNNLDLSMCLNSAWNEIKDRKGKTENGTFKKESQND